MEKKVLKEELNAKEKNKFEENHENQIKKPSFFDPFMPLIEKNIKEMWKKDKYLEVGNIQKFVGESVINLK
jgi:hypothetical protein